MVDRLGFLGPHEPLKRAQQPAWRFVVFGRNLRGHSSLRHREISVPAQKLKWCQTPLVLRQVTGVSPEAQKLELLARKGRERSVMPVLQEAQD